MAISLPALAQFKGNSKPTLVTTERIVIERYQDKTEALGTLIANEAVDITVNVTETISAIEFEDGAHVQRGDVLVRLTSAEEDAALLEAQTTAREAEQQLRRLIPLVKSGTATQSALDEQQRNYDAAKARLIAAQSRLQDFVIRAPFSGTIGLRNISVGALVQPGDVITTLTDSRQVKLDFNVPEVMLGDLSVGLPVIAHSRAYRETQFSGKVMSIDNQIDPVTRSLTVRAILPNEDRRLKPGMLMTLTIFHSEREAIFVSEESIIPQGYDNFVYVAKETDTGWIAEKRKVELGVRRHGSVEVVNGLIPGESVVSHGTIKVAPGGAIDPQPLSTLSATSVTG
ncbi:MexH family multidrug efflux RND transporter periplasmic adaptor subunit [Marinibactrum halimedae]|uniref:MexH family multidrug efflux RND transporter periplasmic adaptor subunit n=2 Tax=Marinibactrum halimedae TaxID=1444977 RepID=A0AA37T6Q7_9GAMM|nr:MexH family multidrug efflux RND transporter periplasmic adaptor subunit [Marinibactrum halimedae]